MPCIWPRWPLRFLPREKRLEKNCAFLNLWEVLADENGDLKAEYAQNDGYHIKPEGYTVWVDYLQTHTVNSGVAV